jgi:hypothetical protein
LAANESIRLTPDSLAEVNDAAAPTQRLCAKQQAARASLAQLDAQIEKEFPQYLAPTDPRPLALDAAQRLLAYDEALINLLTTGEETFAWVLRRDAADFRSVALPRKELVATVQRLRRQLDFSSGDPAQMLAKPFDVAAAPELYRIIA